MLPIEEYIQHFKAVWDTSPETFPDFPNSYSTKEKLAREQNFNGLERKLKELQKIGKAKEVKSDPAKSFFPIFRSFLENVFDFDSEHLNIILSKEFTDVSKDFFYRARKFGPELKPEDIYQGMRNVWIMNGLQLMTAKPVKITPSVFAYSMIYPYSDNLLDNPEIDNTQKQLFSERFDKRLHGQKLEACTHTEKQLFRLIEMFEGEFPRANFPKVYESLYAIQQGQTNSLKMTVHNEIEDDEICYICFEKGGASVLADGYLVAGTLTKEQERALFGYGVYLQLLDDIQDVKEDKQAFTKTIFSCLEEQDLEKFVNKTIHFGRLAMEEMHCFKGINGSDFIGLMNRSIESMLVESVGLNSSWYSKAYLNEIEKVSPLHFDYIRKKRSQSKSKRFALFQKYFDSSKSDLVVS